MACQVRRNDNGNITRVDNSDGTESRLFVDIAKHPLVKDNEEALSLFKNVYTDKLTEQATFTNRGSDGNLYPSYRDALLNTKDGESFEVGFLSEEGTFIPVLSTFKNTNKKTEEGFINHFIEQGVLSPEKTRGQEGYVFQGEGTDDVTKIVNTEILIEDAFAYLGTEGVKRLGSSSFTLEKTSDKIKIPNSDGTFQSVDKKEINSLSHEELQKRYPNDIAMDIVIGREYQNSRPTHKTVENQSLPEVERTEEELQVALLDLLNKMGVKVTSISNYINNYKLKNKVSPSARSLADIANQVVAFQEGSIDLQDLTEETAHFINEAMPQERVENILRNIHRTEEWKQFADIYRRIYSQEFSENDLDQAVRREVLGKVVANSLKNNFSVENKTPIQASIITNARDIVRDFFQRILDYFRPEFKTELNEYLKNVNDLLVREDITEIINTDRFKDNKFRLYNVNGSTTVSGKIYLAAKRSVRALEIQMKNSLSKEKVNKLKLEQVNKNLENAQEIEAVSGILSLSENYVNILNSAIQESERNNSTYLFTNEENVIFHALVQNLAPSLSELKQIVNDVKENKDTWKKLQDQIDNIIKDTNDIKAKASLRETGAIQRLIDRVVERHNLDDSAREYIEGWINNVQKDTNYFHATFGQLLHSRDGLLNLAGSLITDMTNEAHWEAMERQKSLQQTLKRLGIKESDLKQFVDKSGKYIIDEVDHDAFENKRDEIYAESYRKATGTTLTNEEIIKQREDRTLPDLDSAQEKAFKEEERRLLTPEIERRFIPKYYEEYEQRLADNNIQEPTQRFLASYFADIADIKKKATTTVNGKEIVDYSRLSESDLENLEQRSADRKLFKSFVTGTGILKKGLEYKTENGRLVLDENGQPEVILSQNASEEAIIAFDLTRLDQLSREEFAKKDAEDSEIPQRFIDMLNEVDRTHGREAALKFLNANSYMGFSSLFWENLGGTSLVSKLQAAKAQNPTESDTIDNLIDKIVKTNARLRGILKLYSAKNNPSEINAERMSRPTRDTVKELQESLTSLIREANKFARDVETNEEDGGITGISSANNAYVTALREEEAFIESTDSEAVQRAKIAKEFKFASQHIQNDSRKSVERSMDIVDAFLRGERLTVPTSVENILTENGLQPSDLNEFDVYVDTMQQLIRRNLLPYYKRFSPQGLESLQDTLRNADENSLGDAVKNLTLSNPFLEVSPNYSFFDQEQNSNLNENYDENYKGGFVQPKKDLYRNQEFFDLFGEIVDGRSTKNPQLYEAYQAVLEYNNSSLEAMNMSKGHNFFRLPQIRKDLVQRAKDLSNGLSGDKIRSTFQEIFNFTEDDQAKGETQFGTDIKVIPKRFVSRLQDPNDVSDDLFASLVLRDRESTLRKARVKHYGDFMSIYDKMLNRSYNGKAPEATQTLRMFKSAMDYNLFGIKETATYPVDTFLGTFDIAKVARQLLSFIKFRNLGFNVIIPLTSAITGKAVTFNEKLIGEHIHRRSIALGNKEFRRLVADGMKEFGQINTEAEINVLGQFFRAFDLEDSVRNSNYSFLVRNAPRTGMALHTAANYPVYGEILMGILHDYRVSEGRLKNFNAFRQQKKAQGLSADEIKQEWAALEDQVLYKFLSVDKGQVVIDRDGLKDVIYDDAGQRMSDERFEDYLNNTMNGIQSFTSNVVANVDGQIPNEMRVLAQRHFLLNFFMTHRGWLSIATSRRFKNRHLNTNTGVIEEGSYRSFWNYMGRYLNEYKKSNFRDILGSFRTAFEGADETERRNLKRVGIEMAMLNSLMLVGFLMANAAEDEDNKELFGLQVTNYLLYRTLNELSSVQLGIGNNYVDIIESPFVGLQTVENLVKVGELFDNDEIKRGRYKGMQKNERLLINLIPGAKQVFDLGTMNDTYDTYKFFNKKNINYSPVGYLWNKHDQDKKDKK